MKFFVDEKQVKPKTSGSDKVANKIAAAFNRLQNSFAKRMNKTVDKMNTKRLKKAVVLFSIVFGGMSLYLVINAITRPAVPKLHVDQVNVPKHFNKAGDEETVGSVYVDEETFQNITAFKRYMDSLKTSERPQYDSIIKTRPHLMDSVAILEQVYNLQKQNSEYEK
ncbi:hypothetical protein HRH25_15015 [Flavisolibacter sp. BT320]|nr:hypothetical protein [Flavisolibacter longurius]